MIYCTEENFPLRCTTTSEPKRTTPRHNAHTIRQPQESVETVKAFVQQLASVSGSCEVTAAARSAVEML